MFLCLFMPSVCVLYVCCVFSCLNLQSESDSQLNGQVQVIFNFLLKFFVLFLCSFIFLK